MLKLVPMQQTDFEVYLGENIQKYAQEHVRVGNWKPSEAVGKSRKEHELLLPNGVQSKNQHLFSIVDEETGTKVGILWVNIEGGRAFIYDFMIDETLRGKSYGKQALIAMDAELKAMNVESVGLHVFGDNPIAQGLYKKMGFRITGLNMRKTLK